MLRILPGTNSSSAWRTQLAKSIVPDLTQIEGFKEAALFSGNPEPAIVLEFPTMVTTNLNFFGLPEGAGDSVFNNTAFATKIKSVSVVFYNYRTSSSDPGGLPKTPYVYLIPIGSDVMRSPRASFGDDINFIRGDWNVLDQWLPVPYNLSGSADPAITSANYVPVNQLAAGQQSLGTPRGYDAFLAATSGQPTTDPSYNSSQLISRSVWNTDWLLVIPSSTLTVSGDPNEGLNRLIYGGLLPGGSGQRDLNGISDIHLTVQAYSYRGR
jgi:hypothetical protein